MTRYEFVFARGARVKRPIVEKPSDLPFNEAWDRAAAQRGTTDDIINAAIETAKVDGTFVPFNNTGE